MGEHFYYPWFFLFLQQQYNEMATAFHDPQENVVGGWNMILSGNLGEFPRFSEGYITNALLNYRIQSVARCHCGSMEERTGLPVLLRSGNKTLHGLVLSCKAHDQRNILSNENFTNFLFFPLIDDFANEFAWAGILKKKKKILYY